MTALPELRSELVAFLAVLAIYDDGNPHSHSPCRHLHLSPPLLKQLTFGTTGIEEDGLLCPLEEKFVYIPLELGRYHGHLESGLRFQFGIIVIPDEEPINYLVGRA